MSAFASSSTSARDTPGPDRSTPTSWPTRWPTRDNAAFGARDEFYGLASPEEYKDIEAPELDLWREELLTVPTADKVALAIELEAATKAVDPRIRGLRSASYGDAAAESAVVNSLGVEVVTRRTVCSCSAFAMAGDGNETQTGGGFSMGRAFADLDLEKAAHDAADRAVRLLGATQPASRRLPVVLDPQVTRSLVSLIGSALSAESIQKGRSMFVARG